MSEFHSDALAARQEIDTPYPARAVGWYAATGGTTSGTVIPSSARRASAPIRRSPSAA